MITNNIEIAEKFVSWANSQDCESFIGKKIQKNEKISQNLDEIKEICI